MQEKPSHDTVSKMIKNLTDAAQFKTGFFLGTKPYSNIKSTIKNVDKINNW